MKPTIIFFLILFPIFLFGQKGSKKERQIEASYICASDSFLVNTFSAERFKKYCSFRTIYYFSLNGTTQSFPRTITDTTITNIVTAYVLSISEIAYKKDISIEFHKKLGKRIIRYSENIPNYILNQKPRDILDTTDIKKIIENIGIKDDKLSRVECAYNKDLKCFTYTIEEMIIPFNEKTNSWSINRFEIDAITGQLLKEEHNVKIQYIG